MYFSDFSFISVGINEFMQPAQKLMEPVYPMDFLIHSF